MPTITVRGATMLKMRRVKRSRRWSFADCIDIWASREIKQIQREEPNEGVNLCCEPGTLRESGIIFGISEPRKLHGLTG